ncbi:MAG: hypothetical protein RR550_05100 [Rikenellaceae bacterium]
MRLAIIRSLKFLCYLLVMFAVVYGLMLAVNMSQVRPDQFGAFLSTSRGQLMIAAILGLSALYPFFGVTTKKMTRVGSAEIVLAMEANGFKLKRKEDKKMVFIPVKVMDRVRLRFDDSIEIDNSGEVTTITGARRAVYTVLYKLGGEIL